MKIKLGFIIAFIGLSFDLFSQPYTKIPEDPNYFWKQSSDCGATYQLRFYKDTLIRSIKYAKYSLFGGTTGTIGCSPSFVYNGYLRQDSAARKVFVLDPNLDERPLYNFNKVVGDTLLIYDRVTNSNLTYTVQYTNANQTMQGLVRFGFFTTYVSQGIGSLQGGLYACAIDPNNSQLADRLICHGKIAPYQIISPPDVGFEGMCYLNTGLSEENELFTNILLSPNPAGNMLSVNINNAKFLPVIASIYDTSGNLVVEGTIVEDHHSFSLEHLSSGLYFVKIKAATATASYRIAKL